MEQQGKKAPHIGLGFIAGLVVGGVLALTLGTKKGRKFAEEILKECGGVCDKCLENYPELKKKNERIIEKVSKLKDEDESVFKYTNSLRALGHKTAARFFHKKGKPLI